MSANRLQFWSPRWSFSTAFQLFAKLGNFLFLDSDSKEQYKKNLQNNIKKMKARHSVLPWYSTLTC